MRQHIRAGAAVLAATALVVTGCAASEDRAMHATQRRAERISPAAALATPGAARGTIRKTAPVVHVPPNHCAHNTGERLVLVSIRAQRAWLCARHRTVFSTAVTTGASARKGDATPRGSFRIQGLDRDTVLYPAGGGAYPLKYWIPFQAPLYGFHDAPWQKIPYGSPRYVTRGSHGCIHLPLPAIKFLYGWARIGTRVRIR